MLVSKKDAYENLIDENKNMAEFLKSLGYTQEQITDIANGSKTPSLDSIDVQLSFGGAE